MFYNLHINWEWFALQLTKLKNKYPELIVIDIYALQCPNEICRTAINGYPVYRQADLGGHISEYASYAFAKEYLQLFNNPFEK